MTFRKTPEFEHPPFIEFDEASVRIDGLSHSQFRGLREFYCTVTNRAWDEVPEIGDIRSEASRVQESLFRLRGLDK